MKQIFFPVLFALVGCVLFKQSCAETTPCALRATEFGYVCVCNATYCDFLDQEEPTSDGDFIITSSSMNGLRFSRKRGEFSDGAIIIEDYGQVVPNLVKEIARIDVDRSTKFQEILDFGGSITGTVSYLLSLLPEALQNGIYRSYYSQEGLSYDLLRLSIGGSDFDFEPWAYNEFPENDKALSNFTELDPRDKQKLKQIDALRVVTKKDNLKVMLCAWSPPKWMKTSGEWSGHSALKKEYYQTWADYHLRMVEIWEENGLPIWALSTGNEPLNAVERTDQIVFLTLGWVPEDQARWVAENFGPTIKTSKFSHLKLYGNEDWRTTFPSWFITMNETNPKAMDYLDGLSVHVYYANDVNTEALDETHALFPDKTMLNTESCVMTGENTSSLPVGSWEHGEQYINFFFKDLRHSIQGFIDWNLLVNEQGGPNYVANYVDAAIIVNETNRAEVYKQPIFYCIGHLSKFVPKGSVRVGTNTSNDTINAVAFERPDDSMSVVFYNSGDSPVDVTLADSEKGELVISIPERSIHSIVYK